MVAHGGVVAGGVHGCWGACVVAGDVWLPEGAWFARGVWLQGACMVGGCA